MIRYGGCIWGNDELRAVADVINSGNWACGERTAEFEEKFARWQGREHALFVNSGSSALLLAMAALPPHCKVAMPALQFATLYSAAIWCGHTPVLVDIDDSLNMSVDRLFQVIDQVDAVAFVHMAGNPQNITEISDMCDAHGVFLLEDACEAMGSWNHRKAGNFGLTAAFSTHGAHHMATGEGGLVVTDNEGAYAKMHRLRDWGRAYGTSTMEQEYFPGYVFGELGFNLHATDIQAALGLCQLGRLPGFIQRRRANYDRLLSLTGRLPYRPPYVGKVSVPSWFTFPMLVSDRDKLAKHLEGEGIESRPIVAGNMARQPIGPYVEPDRYPVAERWYHGGLWVSVHPKLLEEDLQCIANALTGFWSQK